MKIKFLKENYKVQWLQDNFKSKPMKNKKNILRIKNLNRKTSKFYSCYYLNNNRNKQQLFALGIFFRKISTESYYGEIRIVETKNDPQIYLLKIEK